MSNWIHPIIFDNPDAESKFYQSEACNTTDDLPVVDQGVDLMAANASPKLFGDLIPSTGADIEVLPMQAEILTPPEVGFPTAPLSPHVPPYPRTEVQVAGDLYVYRQDQVGSPRPVVAAESKPSSAPKPLELAEKLLKMDSFAMYEKQLYVFDRKRGIYLALDRDDAKRIIVNRLSDDLRIRGTAYQIKEVYEYLRLHPHIRVVDKAPRHLLAFTNGILDLQTSTFTYGYDPEDFVTWRLEIPFDLNQNNCPVFHRVLQQVSGGDLTFISRLLDIMAFLMIPCPFIKAIPLFQGISGTGKSLIARLISSFYDQSCISHVAAYQFRDRFSAAALLGKQLNVSMDLPGGKISPEAAAMLKQVSGGDEVFIEKKGIDGHSAHLDCRFLFGTNHPFVPSIRDEAFMDRIVLLPFQYPVPPEIADPDLLQKLLPERTAIFNMVLDAFWLWQEDHYQFFGEDIYGIRVAGLGNQQADPLVAAFVRDRCVLDPNGQIPTSTLFAAFEAFLADNSHSFPGNIQQFSRLFNEVTPSSVSIKKVRVNGTPTNCYIGVSLKGETHGETR